jgi:acyl-CoA thioesterase
VPFEFDTDTAVHRIAPEPVASPATTSTYGALFSDGWNIGDKPNGGYVMATAVRAMQSELALHSDGAHIDPLTVTGHYLRPSEPGPVEIAVEVVRAGRLMATVEASVMQAGKERVRCIATFGNFDAITGPTTVTARPPEVPPPAECVDRRPFGTGPTSVPSIQARLVTRMHPDTGWVNGRPSGNASVSGWLGFADGREPDTVSLPLFADAFAPAVFELLKDSGWVPTIELTVHIRARPAPGLLAARFATTNLVNGLLDEEGELWDSEGRLVAQSRQLAMLINPAL